MKPTLESCYSQSRSLLGDDTVVGGQVFTDTVLQPHISQAIRELYRTLIGTTDPFDLTDAYYVLPPNTGVLDPASAGLTNFSQPEWLEWQLANTPVAVSNCVVGTLNGNPVATITTSTPHGLATGATIVSYNIGGFDYFNNPNDLWTITVTGASTLTLNGCTATGTYTSGGFVVSVTGNFAQMNPTDAIDAVGQTAGTLPLSEYAWEGGVLRFYPNPMAVLIHMTFRSSGVVPTSSSMVIPFDDCQDYIAVRTAGLAAKAKGAQALGQQLTSDAIGPMNIPDGNGGLLHALVQPNVRNMQRIMYRHQSFRARRNRPDFLLW